MMIPGGNAPFYMMPQPAGGMYMANGSPAYGAARPMMVPMMGAGMMGQMPYPEGSFDARGSIGRGQRPKTKGHGNQAKHKEDQ